jgi:hypothetical protein
MNNEYRGEGTPDDNTFKPWPKSYKYEKPGHNAFYKSIVTAKQAHPAGSAKKARQHFWEYLEDTSYLIADLVYMKHLDYGSRAILDAPYGPLEGVVTRLHDKMERAKNLTQKDVKPENESLRDTFKDIAGYALIALALLDKNFPEK